MGLILEAIFIIAVVAAMYHHWKVIGELEKRLSELEKKGE